MGVASASKRYYTYYGSTAPLSMGTYYGSTAPLSMGVLLTMAGDGLRRRQQAPARYNAEDGLLGGRADETAALMRWGGGW